MILHLLSGLITLWAGLGFLFTPDDRTSMQTISGPASEIQAAIDAYVAEEMRGLDIPGVAIAVVQGDDVYTQGYGVAGPTGRVVTSETPFLIASLSKSFTALGVMQLAEAGEIDLDAPVQAYLPWFQGADAAASSRITVRHLLNHTSGFSELGGYARNLETDRGDDALEASVRRLSTATLAHPPGATFEYSNTNYDVLGLLIQTVSGQPYETYIRESIFAPLDMQNSFTSLADARTAGSASGYYSFFGLPLAYDRLMPYSRTVLPSAGLFASAEDMARYLSAHLNDGSYRGDTLVSPAGLAELLAPGPEIGDGVNYAMGWVRFPFTDAADTPGAQVPTAISHAGDWAGFKAVMLLVPERELGVVVLMNKSDPIRQSAFYDLGWNVALLAMGLDAVDYPPADNFVARNQRGILLGVLLLLALGLAWSVRLLSRRPLQKGGNVQRRRQLLVLLVALAILDATLAGYLLLVKLPESNNSLPLSLRFEPDIGLLYVALLAMTLGWGTLRTILMLRKAFGRA